MVSTVAIVRSVYEYTVYLFASLPVISVTRTTRSTALSPFWGSLPLSAPTAVNGALSLFRGESVSLSEYVICSPFAVVITALSEITGMLSAGFLSERYIFTSFASMLLSDAEMCIPEFSMSTASLSFLSTKSAAVESFSPWCVGLMSLGYVDGSMGRSVSEKSTPSVTFLRPSEVLTV